MRWNWPSWHTEEKPRSASWPLTMLCCYKVVLSVPLTGQICSVAANTVTWILHCHVACVTHKMSVEETATQQMRKATMSISCRAGVKGCARGRHQIILSSGLCQRCSSQQAHTRGQQYMQQPRTAMGSRFSRNTQHVIGNCVRHPTFQL